MREGLCSGDRDGAAEQVVGFPWLAEHAQRMKAADLRTRIGGSAKKIEIAGAAAVHASRSRAPADARGDRVDRVVGYGQKNEIGGVSDLLGRGAGPGSANAPREFSRRSRTAARHRDDAAPRAREAQRESRSDPPGAYETECDFFRCHLPCDCTALSPAG